MAREVKLTSKQINSLLYHSNFNYPLTETELKKWLLVGKILSKTDKNVSIKKTNGYYYIHKRDLETRVRREKYSKSKILIAKKAANFLANFPSIKFVGITGSLAMKNADKSSDIDLMIITSHDSLWLTRGCVLLVLKLFGFDVRRAGSQEEKDKLCLNLWMDESDLPWRQRNSFTAHEIAQIIPLFNKDNVFENFIWQNKWILNYWPNSLTVKFLKRSKTRKNVFLATLNKLAFKFQYLYMKSKITKEYVSLTRAQFHPNRNLTS